MLKQPPCISSSEILRVRAFSDSCASSTDSCTMFFWSASRMTGTSRPRSVSTATPMLTYFLRMISPAAMSIDALNCGNTRSAAATTLTAIAVTVRLPPAASTCFAYFLRSSSRPVMSARSNCVTCGIVAHAALRCSAVLRRTARIGCRSTSPQRVKSGSGTAARRRRRRRRRRPAASRAPSRRRSRCGRRARCPTTSLMSTPSSRAIRRTDGAAGAGGVSGGAAGFGRRPRAAADVDDVAVRAVACAVGVCGGLRTDVGSLTPALSGLVDLILRLDVGLHVRGLVVGFVGPRRLGLRRGLLRAGCVCLLPCRLRRFAPSSAAALLGLRRRASSSPARLSAAGAAAGAVLDREDRLADLDLVARLDLDLFHRAGDRRRHFDRRLVGFELEDRLILRDRVAGLDQDAEDVAGFDLFAELGKREVSQRNRTSSR